MLPFKTDDNKRQGLLLTPFKRYLPASRAVKAITQLIKICLAAELHFTFKVRKNALARYGE
jgi:hypothetical protein